MMRSLRAARSWKGPDVPTLLADDAALHLFVGRWSVQVFDSTDWVDASRCMATARMPRARRSASSFVSSSTLLMVRPAGGRPRSTCFSSRALAWLRLRPETSSSSSSMRARAISASSATASSSTWRRSSSWLRRSALTHLGAGRLEVPERPFFQAHDFFPPGPEFALLGGVVVSIGSGRRGRCHGRRYG